MNHTMNNNDVKVSDEDKELNANNNTVKTERVILSLTTNTRSKGLYFSQSPWLRMGYRALDFVFFQSLNSMLCVFVLCCSQIKVQ